LAICQQAVDAGDSYVIDVLNVVAHEFGGDHGFFGYGDVAGSRRDDHDYSLAVTLAIALEGDRFCQGTVLGLVLMIRGCGVSECGEDGGVLFFGGTRGENVAAVGGQAEEDGGYLGWRFAGGKDHLGHALAEGAMVVDFGEAQVLEGEVAKTIYGFVGGETLFPDLLK
jgi:hypothetical protein